MQLQEIIQTTHFPQRWHLVKTIIWCHMQDIDIDRVNIQKSYNSTGIPLVTFFFFFKLIYFNWRLITLQYCSGFCQTSTWISHGCTCVPHPEPPSHPIPQGHPSAPALSTLSHASNLDWRSSSHMIIYMFQHYPLKSSHPHLLPQSLKDCSLHLCLFCCLAYRVIVTILLNSIYTH